jgi:FtsZ-binding cell division protein ZapB
MSDALMEQNDAKRTALGTLLIEKGFLDQERLDEALRIGGETGERLGEVVVRLGWASEEDLAKLLAEQWHLRYWERSAISFDGKALRRMSREDATRLEALPIQETDDGSVIVAVAEPTDARLLALRELLGDRIDFVVVAKTAIDVGLRSELLAKNGSSAVETEPTPAEPAAEHSENGDGAESTGQFGGFGDEVQEQREQPAEEPFGTNVFELRRDPAEQTEQNGAAQFAGFDEVAQSLSEALTSQLSLLRGIVTEAEAKADQDRREIERLQAEVSGLHSEVASLRSEVSGHQAQLDERNETIRSMQRTLREYADSLDKGW